MKFEIRRQPVRCPREWLRRIQRPGKSTTANADSARPPRIHLTTRRNWSEQRGPLHRGILQYPIRDPPNRLQLVSEVDNGHTDRDSNDNRKQTRIDSTGQPVPAKPFSECSESIRTPHSDRL